MSLLSNSLEHIDIYTRTHTHTHTHKRTLAQIQNYTPLRGLFPEWKNVSFDIFIFRVSASLSVGVTLSKIVLSYGR
jgi:hypothetical protein